MDLATAARSRLEASCAAPAARSVADARFSALYRRFGPVVFARCRKLLGDRVLAEDATQEVFVRVYGHLDRTPADGEVLLWIYRITTNYCLSLLRQRAVRGVEVQPGPLASGQPDLAHHIEERDLLLQVLASLPEKLRAPALLYFLDGLDQQQVARTLGISRRTVVTRLQMAQAHARDFQAGQALAA